MHRHESTQSNGGQEGLEVDHGTRDEKSAQGTGVDTASTE